MNRILVIDEDRSVQELYADELTEEGYEVLTTNRNSTIMDMVQYKKPDLIVLDINTDQGSGFELLEEIQHRYCTPVILSTAYPTFKSDLEADAWGCRIVKNYDLEELKLQVKTAFEKGTAISEITSFLRNKTASMQ